MKVKSKIYASDTPNLNGIIYPKDELKKAVDKFNLSENFVTFGNYPPLPLDKVDLAKTVGTVKLEYSEDGYVMAKMNVFDTPHGIMLKSILTGQDKDKVVSLPTASGKITDDKIVNDLNIISVSCLLKDNVNIGVETSLFTVEVINPLLNDNLFKGIEETMNIVEIDE